MVMKYINRRSEKEKGKSKKIYLIFILIFMILLILFSNNQINNFVKNIIGFAILEEDCGEWGECYFIQEFKDNKEYTLEGEKKRICNNENIEITETKKCYIRVSATLKKVDSFYEAHNLDGILISKTEFIEGEPKKIKIECDGLIVNGICSGINDTQINDTQINDTVINDTQTNETEENITITLTINSPDLEVYSNRRVLLDIITSEKVDKIVYVYNNRERRLCRNCDSVNKKVRFKEGSNEIIFKAIKDGEVVNEKTVSFSIDSRKPKIRKTIPKKNSYINSGDFSVIYNEQNLESVRLIISDQVIEFEGCTSGNRQECSKKIDLSNYEGTIDYYFFIEDISGNNATKYVRNIKVDITSPIINN